MKEYKNNIDIDKLSTSYKTLDSINNNLNSIDLEGLIIDLENEIKKINFLHNNCISNYKKSIDYIIDKTAKIKKDINKLTNSIDKTITNYSNIDELRDKDLMELSSIYKKTQEVEPKIKYNITNLTTSINDSKITKIAPIEEQVEEKSEINTIPIGLGIAATGISASIGAVALDSMNNKSTFKDDKTDDDKNTDIEIYKDSDMEVLENDDEGTPIIENINETEYHATRDKDEMSKFYGDEINN